MKVLQINSVCGYGSTGRIAADINRVLLQNGDESIIAYGREKAPDNIKTVKIGSDLDIYFHVLQTRVFDRHGFSSVNATKKLIREIEALDPDIIHLHNLHGYYINIKVLLDYLSAANKPVVLTLHDCWAFTGHCAYFDYAGCDKWKTGCFECPQKSGYPSSFVFDNSKDNYKRKSALFNLVKNIHIVTPSYWLAGLVKQSFLKSCPVTVIPNGVNLNVFKPTASNFRATYNLENKFIVLGVASVWEERKGLKYISQLSEELDDKYKVIVIGVSRKQRAGLPDNIIGICRTNNVRELVEIYSAADVFVNPTLEDNFPATNLEALACGTPVITFDTGGSPECIDDSCGLVIEKGNTKALVSGVKSMFSIPKENFQCREKASKYSNNTVYKSYIDIYNKLYNG